jgi:hypothetical protein
VPLHAEGLVPKHGQPSRGLPLQLTQFGSQVTLQVPLEQVALATKFEPTSALQLSQFGPHADASVIWSTQVPLHMAIPGAHAHVPLTHVPFVPQLCPHVAQLFASVIKLTQPPLHSVSPVGHCDTHIPAEQSSPDGHGAPQAPRANRLAGGAGELAGAVRAHLARGTRVSARSAVVRVVRQRHARSGAQRLSARAGRHALTRHALLAGAAFVPAVAAVVDVIVEIDAFHAAPAVVVCAAAAVLAALVLGR